MTAPLKPWPYIVLAPAPMVRIIQSQKTDIDNTENPLSIFVKPKVLKSLFNQQDLTLLYRLNNDTNGLSVPASGTTRPEFFTTFWGEEITEECKTLCAALSSSPNVTPKPLSYVNTANEAVDCLLCQIPTNLKPIQEKDDDLVLPESMLIVPLLQEQINSLLNSNTNLSQPLSGNQSITLAISTAVLQALYKLYSVEQVSSHPWFEDYVRMV